MSTKRKQIKDNHLLVHATIVFGSVVTGRCFWLCETEYLAFWA